MKIKSVNVRHVEYIYTTQPLDENAIMYVIDEDFEDTAYGRRLSAYQPIFHKDTGEFLGMVGADTLQLFCIAACFAVQKTMQYFFFRPPKPPLRAQMTFCHDLA